MYQLTPKQQQQHDWAVAWQDHGDREALASLVASVDPLAFRISSLFRNHRTLFEEVLSDCRLAAVQAASSFDRSRPAGYVTLCCFLMRDAVRGAVKRYTTPVAIPRRVNARAVSVAILAEPEPGAGGVVLAAEEEIRHDPGLRRVLCSLFDDAGLSARERSILECRHLHGQSFGAMAEARECSTMRVSQLEKSGLVKVQAAAARSGLSLADLL